MDGSGQIAQNRIKSSLFYSIFIILKVEKSLKLPLSKSERALSVRHKHIKTSTYGNFIVANDLYFDYSFDTNGFIKFLRNTL
jgi:hypothetical protein